VHDGVDHVFARENRICDSTATRELSCAAAEAAALALLLEGVAALVDPVNDDDKQEAAAYVRIAGPERSVSRGAAFLVHGALAASRTSRKDPP
jgi:hypothetical protein